MKIMNLTHDVLNGAGIEMQPGETVTVDDEDRGHQLIIRNPTKFAQVVAGEVRPHVPEPDPEPGKSPHRHIYPTNGRQVCTVLGCGRKKSHRTTKKEDE